MKMRIILENVFDTIRKNIPMDYKLIQSKLEQNKGIYMQRNDVKQDDINTQQMTQQ